MIKGYRGGAIRPPAWLKTTCRPEVVRPCPLVTIRINAVLGNCGLSMRFLMLGGEPVIDPAPPVRFALAVSVKLISDVG
jgi:hypothetical protein